MCLLNIFIQRIKHILHYGYGLSFFVKCNKCPEVFFGLGKHFVPVLNGKKFTCLNANLRQSYGINDLPAHKNRLDSHHTGHHTVLQKLHLAENAKIEINNGIPGFKDHTHSGNVRKKITDSLFLHQSRDFFLNTFITQFSIVFCRHGFAFFQRIGLSQQTGREKCKNKAYIESVFH